MKPYTSEAKRAAAYDTLLHHYNHHRTHTGIGGKTPHHAFTPSQGNTTSDYAAKGSRPTLRPGR